MTWQPLFETVLEVDESGIAEDQRGNEVVGDNDVTLLGRLNRVALALGSVVSLGHTPEGADVGYDIPLHCVIHPHTGCHFRSAKLVVDLTATPGTVVRDMAPREVRGENPVEMTTTVGVGLTFDIIPSAIEGELKRERSTRRTVHHPLILSSGRGFARALWDFRSGRDADLHPERELRLVVTAPEGVAVLARFNLRAQVTLGWGERLIPLLRRKSEINETYRLVTVTAGANQ
jgi:hypothetical protein